MQKPTNEEAVYKSTIVNIRCSNIEWALRGISTIYIFDMSPVKSIPLILAKGLNSITLFGLQT